MTKCGKKARLRRLTHTTQKTHCERTRLASNSVWIHSVEIRRKHMVYISSIKKYGWEPGGTQDAITNTDTWQGLAGEDRIFLCLPDNVTGVQPTGEQSIWLWPVAPWQNVLAETLMSAWEASLPPPSRRQPLQWELLIASHRLMMHSYTAWTPGDAAACAGQYYCVILCNNMREGSVDFFLFNLPIPMP